MYKEVVQGTEYDLFSDSVIAQIMIAIRNSVKDSIESKKSEGPAIIGCLAWNDIPMKDGRRTGLYLEYDAKIVSEGVVNAGVNYMILFDEIPDIVLDHLNKMKKILGHDINVATK